MRHWFALLVAATLLAVVLGPGAKALDAAEGEASKPNIVFILADDLGYGDLSSYGADKLETPHIDSLMSAGVRFDSFYANCPVCSPTRAALMTGRYPDLVGVPGVIRDVERNNWGYFDPASVTLPDVLGRGGYHTALVGKWHLGLRAENHPNSRGFDFFHGFLGDMMDDYYTHRRHGHNFMRRNRETIDPDGHATNLFTEWAVDYIRRRKNERKPFFVYLAYNAPHSPIQPPEEWVERIKDRQPQISEKRAKFGALVEHMDHGIGKVIAALKETGQWGNTLTVFHSDNGGAEWYGADNGALRGGKQDMYEGGIRVPTCAVWPGRIEPGTRSDVVGMTMDWMPTLAEAAGVTVEREVEGVSLMPALRGERQELDRTMFWMRREGGRAYMGQPSWAVRKGGWKLVQNRPGEPFELYHLAEDPKEQNDLADDRKKKFNELANSLRAHVQRAGQVPWQKPE